MSSQFWIYIAVTIPLMLMTMGYWRYVAGRRKKQKEDAIKESISVV
jgi:hypothetical protein